MSSDAAPQHKHHINITHVLLDSFLAMLLLLLTVSCGVVLRSFLVRRRVRSHIRQAIAAGFEVDEHGNITGRQPKPKQLGEKPVMWEVWLDEKGGVSGESQDITLSTERYSNFGDEKKCHEGPWNNILPVSVKVLPAPSPPPMYLVSNPSLVSNATQLHHASRRPVSPSVVAVPPAPDKLEVSVLISMPNPNCRFAHGQANGNYAISSKGKEKDDAEEGEVPHLLFGVTEVGLRT